MKAIKLAKSLVTSHLSSTWDFTSWMTISQSSGLSYRWIKTHVLNHEKVSLWRGFRKIVSDRFGIKIKRIFTLDPIQGSCELYVILILEYWVGFWGLEKYEPSFTLTTLNFDIRMLGEHHLVHVENLNP